MDPNACWERLISAIEEGNAFDASAAAEDLALWIERGGFVPNGLAVAIVAQRNTSAPISLIQLQKALKY